MSAEEHFAEQEVEETAEAPAASAPPSTEGGEASQEEEDQEIAEMRRKVQEMREEAERIEKMQRQAEEAAGSSSLSSSSADARSIYIGSVDYGATAEELQAHFQGCGTVERVTIMTDRFTGHPKGFAYMEFTEEESVQNALALNDSLFRGRQLKVTAKRTNVPSFMLRGRRPRRPAFGYAYPRPRRSRRPAYHPYA